MAAAAADPLRILHLALTADWAQALEAGHYEISSRGRTLEHEGFIHASTSSQAPGVLDRYYADLDPATLTVLVIDIDRLERAGSPVRWDEVPGHAEPFPHVYGPIAPDAVVTTLELDGVAGSARLPDLSGWHVVAGQPQPVPGV